MQTVLVGKTAIFDQKSVKWLTKGYLRYLMIMAKVQQQERQQDAKGTIVSEYRSHEDYEVKNETGECLGISILVLYYGQLWETALDRLNHKIDGHLFTICHQGIRFGVYRKLHKVKYLKLV